ncbi:MAG: metal-dependent transcriptional regulator [Candidatus Hodarchaeales archaeon]
MHLKTRQLRIIEEEIMETLFDISVSNSGKRIKMGDILQRLGKSLTKTQLTNIVRRKLEPSGFLDYLPYEGVLLKPEGFKVAKKIARNHRVAEAMLYYIFNVPFTKLHDLACQLEHGINDEIAEYVYQKLKGLGVKTTPFGMPIPMDDVEDMGCDDECLHTIPPGTPVTLRRVQSHSSETAKELEDLNIKEMGIHLLVEDIDNEGVIIRIKDNKVKIPMHLSKNLCVKREIQE